jgi:hypothetical protein
MAQQIGLFAPELPQGFLYKTEFISPAEEQTLVSQLRQLPFRPFEYQGYTARRNVVEYGYEYDYNTNRTASAAPIPEFLNWLKRRAAEFAGVQADELIECVRTSIRRVRRSDGIAMCRSLRSWLESHC